MANIFLTYKCNLKCPYCFADEFVNKDTHEISIENFKTVLEFIKTGNERVGLIGGEPLLHSRFTELINIIVSDSQIQDIMVFTNGLLMDRHIDELSGEKITILVNCNSPHDIGINNFIKLKNNLLLLNDKKKDKLNLGINLYFSDFDYSYIFELLRSLDKHYLRFSIAYHNSCKENSENVLESFDKIKPLLFNFFEDCLNNNVVPHNDCNSIPSCLLNVREKKLLLQIESLAYKYHINSTISSIHTCTPVIDIFPDLTAVRCFGLSKYLKKNIQEFRSIKALRDYFFNSVDIYAKSIYESINCQDCKTRLINKCGICYTYKLQKIEKMKKIIAENINNFS